MKPELIALATALQEDPGVSERTRRAAADLIAAASRSIDIDAELTASYARSADRA